MATFLPVSDFGLPPFRPLALAASKPAWVRSLIKFRSRAKDMKNKFSAAITCWLLF
jgi:hypothetical protein